MANQGESVFFRYKFSFENGMTREFLLTLDPKTFQLAMQVPDPIPEWTALEYHKCPNCPLKEAEHPYCPAAMSLVDVVDFFKDKVSYDKAYMTIESGPRTYIGKVPIQEGIKSVVGLCMTAAGCPILDSMRPMLRAHLPFPSMGESVYRLVSMYLLAQYFLHREGKTPDWDLKNLIRLCNDVQVVNKSFFKRLRGERVKDASLNALVALDSFAAYAASFLEDNTLQELKSLFGPYLGEFKT